MGQGLLLKSGIRLAANLIIVCMTLVKDLNYLLIPGDLENGCYRLWLIVQPAKGSIVEDCTA